jgi:hypothetical protein
MKWIITSLIVLSAVSVFSQSFRAGASQHHINPSIPSFIAGHSQNRLFTGVQDSLFVKVVVISNNEKRLAIITYDCIGMLYPHLQILRERMASRKNRVPVDHIVMSSTHSHAGPDVVGLWGADLMHSGVDSIYMERVLQVTEQQIDEAVQKMEPVEIVYGEGLHQFAWVKNISEPEELDRTVSILQCVNKKSKSVATLTNFACHPTFVDAVHSKVSSDYPAGFYRTMDKELGGVNLFLQGAIGGWVQPEGEPQTFDQAYMRGKELAVFTRKLLAKPTRLQGSQISFRSALIEMPVENPGFRQLAKAGVINRSIDATVKTELAVFSIGNAMFATHPGETVPEMSLATRKLLNTNGPKFILGLSMDALGYIVKPYFFDPARKIPHAEYLCSMSVGPESSIIVMKTLADLTK